MTEPTHECRYGGSTYGYGDSKNGKTHVWFRKQGKEWARIKRTEIPAEIRNTEAVKKSKSSRRSGGEEKRKARSAGYEGVPVQSVGTPPALPKKSLYEKAKGAFRSAKAAVFGANTHADGSPIQSNQVIEVSSTQHVCPAKAGTPVRRTFGKNWCVCGPGKIAAKEYSSWFAGKQGRCNELGGQWVPGRVFGGTCYTCRGGGGGIVPMPMLAPMPMPMPMPMGTVIPYRA